MKQARTTIVNRLGLHARAATQLVNCASAFASGIWITLGSRRVNGGSWRRWRMPGSRCRSWS